MRGEHGCRSGRVQLQAGPSPRARGARPRRARRLWGIGTIPACAGSTSRPGPTPRPDRDHPPRVRGEHAVPGKAGDVVQGPSPRAWGALPSLKAHVRRIGTIPACVGSTRGRSWTPPPHRDHPRVRGEHFCGSGWARRRRGPSPRAWGALSLTCGVTWHEGGFLLLLRNPAYCPSLRRSPILGRGVASFGALWSLSMGRSLPRCLLMTDAVVGVGGGEFRPGWGCLVSGRYSTRVRRHGLAPPGCFLWGWLVECHGWSCRRTAESGVLIGVDHGVAVTRCWPSVERKEPGIQTVSLAAKA